MTHFHYQRDELFAEEVPIKKIVKKYATPTYIYSYNALEQMWKQFDSACGSYPHQICYAVKANSNIAVLNCLAQLGSGFDIVSGGELERVLIAGGKPQNIIFSGVGKLPSEIERALELEIGCFDVESHSELQRIQAIAKSFNKTAPISLRINPDITIDSHPYITTGIAENKFGISYSDALDMYQTAAQMSHIRIKGIACHLGSQITELEPFVAALEYLVDLVTQLKHAGIQLEHINIGGGLGVCYHDESVPSPEVYCHTLIEKLRDQQLKLIIEPGRAIAADAGILITRVEYIKHTSAKNFAVVDAAMNDLLRPALYSAWHGIIPIKLHKQITPQIYDVVGPVCESADFLGKNRHLAIVEGDLLAICTTGAYGFTMSSNYNSRPKCAEIMVKDTNFKCINKREKLTDLFKREAIY